MASKAPTTGSTIASILSLPPLFEDPDLELDSLSSVGGVVAAVGAGATLQHKNTLTHQSDCSKQ